MSETIKNSEKQMNANLSYHGLKGNRFFYIPENYEIGVEKVSIDNTVDFSSPNSANNAFYNSMLTAEAVDFNTVIESGVGENYESWYKFLTNVVSAHLNGGKGKYIIDIDNGMDIPINIYIYDINGTLVVSEETGKGSLKAELDFAETYFIRATSPAFVNAPYALGLTCENNGGVADNATTSLVDNSLIIYYSLSSMPRSFRIKKAEITFYQKSVTGQNIPAKIGIYGTNSAVYPGFELEVGDMLCDCVKAKLSTQEGEPISYTFDVTEVVEKCEYDNSNYLNLLLKAVGVEHETDSILLYGNDSDYAPKMTVTYETSLGVGSYRADSNEIGRFGQGSVDLQYGNLTFENEDFAWGGNRMPVTIKHLYNSALYNEQYTAKSAAGLNIADFSAMKLGCGYKLNIMQSMVKNTDDKYIYTDDNGNEIYFTVSEKDTNVFVSSEEDGELEYNESTRILENGGSYLFDESGRLIKIIDQNENTTLIEYVDGKIATVTDAVNRVFAFSYDDNGFLTSITAPDSTQITYTYANNLLTTVNYPEGKRAEITYTSQKPASVMLYDGEVPVYKLEYTFTNSAVSKVVEYGYKDGVAQKGITKTYTYSPSAGRTVVDSSENSASTVYVFDNDGEIISEYLVPLSNIKIPLEDGKGVTTVNNLLAGHSFEDFSANWSMCSQNLSTTTVEVLENENIAKYGKTYLKITSTDSNAICNGIYQTLGMPEDDYTFSAYMRIVSGFEGENDGAYLRIYDKEAGIVLAQSEKLKIKDDEFVRVSASFVGGFGNYCAEILLDGAGVVEINAPQFEGNAAANSYNMLSDSELNSGKGWSLDNAEYTTDEGFRWYGSLKINGDVNNQKSSGQAVTVKTDKATRESFKLSGWAKGYALPSRKDEQSPTFRLRAVINYADGTTTQKPITADFCPYTSDWQYTSVEFAKDAYKEVVNVEIFCDYDYNFGEAYFDDIELIRTSIETKLAEDDFVIEEEEDTNETENEQANETQDTEETEENSDEFEEFLDAFGNTLTDTTFTDGEYGTIYSSFGYDEDGNNLVKETDARGNVTEYTVNGVTSRNEEVIDRLGNKTAYTYDDAGRVINVTSKSAENDVIATVSYNYDSFDNLTEIVRGDGLKYMLKYSAFKNLESIGIDGKTDGDLVAYTYKTGSGRLNGLTYANGDKMTATFDGNGNMIAEKWTDKDGNQTAYYKYGYDSQGEIVRTIDILAKKMYNYTYDNGRIEQAVESAVTFNEYDFVASKTVISTIRYYYDNEGTLTKKRIISANGEQVITYTAAENESQLVKTVVGEHSFVSTSKNDSFGRKEFDELQLGSGFVSRKFDYLNGSITEEHKDNKLLKSTPTTQLVSEITFSDGRTIDYEYDAEERITKVIDSVEGTTEYTYDALGQLLTETKNGQLINAMTYDNYGNILTKNGIEYRYNAIWKDRLSHCGGKEISYDAQGNPLNYLGHILFWEKGRQLKSFDNSIYTYNASGIRTSKTVDNVRHDFYLDSGKILKEVWNGNVLEAVFDNEESVCGIVYNSTPFYFQKNLQGDIIAITDKDGETVARYTYDAWGKCNIDSTSKNAKIAAVNPFRYRGYYYDSETGLYYLQSRYYDPEVGRFINGDMAEFAVSEQRVLGHNLFGYCGNEPNGRVDEFGYKPNYITEQSDNTKVTINGTSKKMKDIKWGKLGNIADNGCGVIAIYNVLLYYSSKVKFENVRKQMSYLGAPLLYGLMGVKPGAITRYLKTKFWFVITASSWTYFWGMKAELSTCVIVLFKWSGFAAHYIAGIRSRSGGVGGYFRFYNTGLGIDGKEKSIWNVVDKIKEKGGVPLAFWGVSGKLGWW